MGAIDYWCNAFGPERRALWDAAIEAQGIPLKVRSDPSDSFAPPGAFVARMDELRMDAVLLPSSDLPESAGPTDYERFTTPLDEVLDLAGEHPGRFYGLWSFDPAQGLAGLRRAEEALSHATFVGLHLHTHSFDRPFDHRDLYPFYALAAEHAVPVVVQAGSSGGLMPSECGKPIGIDRPALYFRELNFVLSHTGWPWVDEAIAMALKHPNVYLGTAAYPPKHFGRELRRFGAGPGCGKLLFGTSFPVVGHRHALGQQDALGWDAVARTSWLEGTARQIFRRIASAR